MLTREQRKEKQKEVSLHWKGKKKIEFVLQTETCMKGYNKNTEEEGTAAILVLVDTVVGAADKPFAAANQLHRKFVEKCVVVVAAVAHGDRAEERRVLVHSSEPSHHFELAVLFRELADLGLSPAKKEEEKHGKQTQLEQ